jgi:membrane associated rhomboid family serine protease
MGIYDRDYYRKEGPSFLGSFTEQGKACKWLIAINVVLFVAQIAVPAVTDLLEVRLSSVSDWSDQAILQTQTFRDELSARLGPEGVKAFDALPPERQEELAKPLVEAVREKFHQPGVFQGRVWQLLTYAFLHSTGGMPWHIIFNMLFLWWFGHEMEELYGAREFTVFYLVSAFLGGLA